MIGLRRVWQRTRLARAYPRAHWEFKAADCWVGIYWEYRPHHCDFDVCYRHRMHVWICLLPMLPLHVTWLVRGQKPRETIEGPG